MTNRPEIVVVGSYVQDHAWTVDRFPLTGETRIGGFSTGPGGKGFNQAVAAHRLGVATRFIGALGDDALALTARTFAAEVGLDCRFETRAESFTAASSILVDASGDNRIVVALGANALLSKDFVERELAKARAARVVVTQLETSVEATIAALAAARAAGAIALLNPAPRNPVIGPIAPDVAEIVTPNETEFAWLIDHMTGDTAAADAAANAATLDDASLGALAQQLGMATVVVTLGAAGCFVAHSADGQRRWHDAVRCYRLPAEPVDARDTTGAGDAFTGALAASLASLADAPLRDALCHASRVAALSTERVGTARAMPTAAEVAARFVF